MKNLITLTAAIAIFGSVAIAAPRLTAVPKDYPLQTCVVSDEILGEHGKPVKVTAKDGTDVYLCCNDCKKDFNKEPERFAKMVRDAKAKK